MAEVGAGKNTTPHDQRHASWRKKGNGSANGWTSHQDSCSSYCKERQVNTHDICGLKERFLHDDSVDG
eukprot:876844-Pyramimonas_sp.AAC.1